MKRILILSALTVAMLLGLVACGSDNEIKDLGVATSDNAVGEPDEKNEDSIMEAEVNKARLYTTEMDRKYRSKIYLYGAEAVFECADIMFETGKEPRHLTSNEYLAIASRVSSEEEFVEEFLKLNITPDISDETHGLSRKTYILDSYFGRASIRIYNNEYGYFVADLDYTSVGSSGTVCFDDPLLSEQALSVVKTNLSDLVNWHHCIETVTTLCEQYEEKDFLILEYPCSEGINKGEVKCYPRLDIDSILRIKEESVDLDAFLEKFNKMMPYPDAIYTTADNKSKKEVYLVESWYGVRNGLIVEHNENGTNIELFAEIAIEPTASHPSSIGDYVPVTACEYYKLNYDELTVKKIDEIGSKSPLYQPNVHPIRFY